MTIASKQTTPISGISHVATRQPRDTHASETTIGRILHKRLAAPTWTTLIDPSKRQEVSGRLLDAELDRLARQQAIENALSAALHLVRTTNTAEGYSKATGRAIRAASMLKQACTEAINGGRA